MKYPKSLLQKNRKQKNKIKNHHLVYQRFPPSIWNENDDYPDFNQIKSDQSFNWSAYSIAEWVRFKEINGVMEYFINNGICSYKVSGIRNITLNKLSKILDVKHEPINNNYSHCELVLLNNDVWNNKKNKREIRLQFKTILTLLVKPNQELTKVKRLQNYLKMYCDRCY